LANKFQCHCVMVHLYKHCQIGKNVERIHVFLSLSSLMTTCVNYYPLVFMQLGV
jgi:hypothetical protein